MLLPVTPSLLHAVVGYVLKIEPNICAWAIQEDMRQVAPSLIRHICLP